MRWLWTLAFGLALWCLTHGAALAETRVALVIGNNSYQHMQTLVNPVTDARNMRDALKKLGFEVVYGEDLDKRAFERSIANFAHSAASADVALVFYAGHGATFGDTPYAVPIDAQLSALEGVPYELVPLESVIGELRRAKGLRIAIIDACRDNAKERDLKRVAARGGEITRGLARVKNPEGLIIAYATQYLSTAADGPPKGDSPFTAALLANIATPGLDVKDMLFKVAQDVVVKTNGEQHPELSISFYDRYALAGSAEAAPPRKAEPLPAPDPCATAESHWRSAEAIGSIAAFEDHLARFPSCTFAGLAKARIESLKTKVAVVAPPALPVLSGPCGGATLATLLSRANLRSRAAAPLSAQEECALKPGDEFKECATCPPMVVVPSGSFMMGSPESEPERVDNVSAASSDDREAFCCRQVRSDLRRVGCLRSRRWLQWR